MALFIAPQVMAMEIEVGEDGAIHFYENRVLGDRDGNSTSGSSGSSNSDDEDEVDDVDNVDDVDDDQDEIESETEDEDDDRVEMRTEIRTIAPYQRKQIEFKREDDGRFKLEIQDGKNKLKLRGARNAQPESVETDSVDLSLPLNQDDNELRERQLELLKQRVENSTEGKSLGETERQELIKQKQEKLTEYYKNLATTRKGKQAEQVRLRSVENSGFELESRAAKAKLQGADFNYDQETGLVSVVTPSGNEHTLTHLPDEAIAQMTAKGFFVDSTVDVSLAPATDESLQYKVASKKSKKLFGLFNRQVDAEVVLDDLTGEVVEQEVEATDGWTRFLNRFTF